MYDQLSNLTGVGVAGLSVFLIWKLATNHLIHLTSAIQELRDAVKELKEWLQNHQKQS